MAYNQELVNYIRQAAELRKLDPDTVLRVVRSEGGLSDPFNRSKAPPPKSQASGLGNTEHSFGPFQLYISGNNKALGDRALKAGIDPRTNWKGGVDFALDEVSRVGWGQWYGAAKAGVGKWDGIRKGQSAPTNQYTQGAVQAATLPVSYNPAVAGAAAQNAAAQVAQSNAAIGNIPNYIPPAPNVPVEATATPKANPFGGLMQAMMMKQSMSAPQAPQHTNVVQSNDGPDTSALQAMPQDPYDQLAMVSMTPSAYYKRRRRIT